MFAVDADTLLLQNFVYDGNGKDTFFWAGSSNRPGSKGFIVPDKSGRTNVLDRYLNEEFTIKLPSQKKITDLKWFAVYDLTSQVICPGVETEHFLTIYFYRTTLEIFTSVRGLSLQDTKH